MSALEETIAAPIALDGGSQYLIDRIITNRFACREFCDSSGVFSTLLSVSRNRISKPAPTNLPRTTRSSVLQSCGISIGYSKVQTKAQLMRRAEVNEFASFAGFDK